MKYDRLKRSSAVLLAALVMAGGAAALSSSVTTEAFAAHAVSASLTNNSSVSDSSITLGKTVTLFGDAFGGAGSYTYGYFYKKSTSSTWSTIKNFSSATSVTLKPGAAVDYNICIKIKDASGTLSKKYFTLKVTPALKCTGSISAQSITKGQTVTLTAAASGGAGSYTYGFFYKKSTSSTWNTLKNYSSDTTAQLKPASAADYDVCIKVKDADGTIARKTFTVKVSESIQFNALISPIAATTKNKGVTLTVQAVSSSNKYSYAFYYKKSTSSTWALARNYGNFSYGDSYTIYPASVGSYQFRIRAKDENGNTRDRYLSISVDYDQLVNLSSIDTQEVNEGEDITITASATGGNGTYSYLYEYSTENSDEFEIINDYSNVNKLTLTMEDAGIYVIRVTVKDGKQHIESTDFRVIVNAHVDPADKPGQIISQIIKNDMSEFDKVLAIHNWIINNTQYDTDGYNSGNIPQSSYEAEGVFEYGVAVCDGYSKAFLQLAQKAGLTAIRVTGIAANSAGNTESHAWNQVKVDGKWYNIDVTWDDPIVSGDYSGDNLRYTYFLVPDSDFTDHAAQSSHNSCTTPQPTDKINAYAIQCELDADPNCAYCENTDEMKVAMANFHNNGINTFRIIYKTSSTDSQQIFNEAFAAKPAGCGARASLMQWKLSGYYEITMTLT